MKNPSPIDDRSLLLTLEESSRLVSHSHDPHETLTNIVRLIQERFHTAVCSVYLLEPERRELVLGATVGLKPESVAKLPTRDELSAAYRKFMQPVHPDWGGDCDLAVKGNLAFETLMRYLEDPSGWARRN